MIQELQVWQPWQAGTFCRVANARRGTAHRIVIQQILVMLVLKLAYQRIAELQSGNDKVIKFLRRAMGLVSGKQYYRASHNIDKTVEGIIGAKFSKNDYFIEAGANDGIRQSNSYFLEKKYEARGLLVEANPIPYAKLVRNRASRNDFACCALVPFGYESHFVSMKNGDLMSFADIDDSHDIPDVSEHMARAQRNMLKAGFKEGIFEFGALARNLTDVLNEMQAPSRIRIFFLDVEGNEINVLKGVDFSKYSFDFIVVECRDIGAMTEFLDNKGYKILRKITHHDYIFSNKITATEANHNIPSSLAG